ncbi:MAG: flagellar hook-basal body complex protein FliE [Pseudomonadota bacterium]
MEITNSLASRFYEGVQGALKPAAIDDSASVGSTPSETAARAAQSFVQTLREAETVSMAGMAGEADPQSVVMALSSAEIAVQSAVTLRDKVVESYNEILRMPV